MDRRRVAGRGAVSRVLRLHPGLARVRLRPPWRRPARADVHAGPGRAAVLPRAVARLAVRPAGGRLRLAAGRVGAAGRLPVRHRHAAGRRLRLGTLFAVGGGNTRMVVTLLFFIVGSVIATANFGWWSALPALAPTSLVKSWGLAPALIANLAVFALIAWTATALEKRRHGHVISFASRTARPGSLLQGPWPLIWRRGAGRAELRHPGAGRPPLGRDLGLRAVGAKTLDALGGGVATWTYWSKQASLAAPLRQDVTTVMDLGLMLGALAAASAAGKFAPVWKVPARAGRRRHRRPAAGLRLAPGLRLQHRRLLQRHPVGQPACLALAAGRLPGQRAGRAPASAVRPGRGKDAACVELLTRHPSSPL